jgi:hypothetical protein
MPPGFVAPVLLFDPNPLPDEPNPELPIPLGPLFEPLFEKPKLVLPLFVGLFAAPLAAPFADPFAAPPFVPDVSPLPLGA